MILVTRLNGPPFALNPDLVERAEATPDTVVTLVDGTKYVLVETVEEIVGLIRDYRALVLHTAHALDVASPGTAGAAVGAPPRAGGVAGPPREVGASVVRLAPAWEG